MIRGQAARRLMGLGEAADRALLEVVGETNEDLAALGRDLVEAIGASKNAELRGRLWTAAGDRDFPWRPAAVSGLSIGPLDGELERFRPLLADRLAAVRVVTIQAWSRLDGDAEVLRGLLTDADDRVRRQAAAALVDAGHPEGLWWLFEELRRSDNFFAQPTGQQARIAANRLLRKRLDDMASFNPSRAPSYELNLSALVVLREKIEALAGEAPELPLVASAGGTIPGERIGLEVRSCREGELFLRWTADDVLLVGQGNPARVQLEEGTVAHLAGIAGGTWEATGDVRFWGEAGCDLEQLHAALEGWPTPQTLILAKGPEPVPDLRPEVLDPLTVQLVRTLPDAPSDDPRLDRLRSRVEAALLAVGGSYEPETTDGD